MLTISLKDALFQSLRGSRYHLLLRVNGVSKVHFMMRVHRSRAFMSGERLRSVSFSQFMVYTLLRYLFSDDTRF